MRNSIFRYYPLIEADPSGDIRIGFNMCKTKEQAFHCSDYCLESMVSGIYRLIAKQPNNHELFYISCPKCGKTLTQIGPIQDEHVRQLYGCKHCNH